jgi:hypothetical protein
MIEPSEATLIARQMQHEPHARAEVWANADGYVVGFDDGGHSADHFATVLVYVDAHTGHAHTIGAGEFNSLHGLHPV